MMKCSTNERDEYNILILTRGRKRTIGKTMD
jgi:hypothetical protein